MLEAGATLEGESCSSGVTVSTVKYQQDAKSLQQLQMEGENVGVAFMAVSSGKGVSTEDTGKMKALSTGNSWYKQMVYCIDAMKTTGVELIYRW
jgi:hypothetical protein